MPQITIGGRAFPYYFYMSPDEQVQAAIEAIEWIRGAGKENREFMFAASIEKDFADEIVNIWFLSAVFSRLGDIDGEVLINDLPTLFVNDLRSEDQYWLHPEASLPMGTAIAIIGTIDYISPKNRWANDTNSAVRITIAAATRNPELLSFLSNDPCMVVRTVVALNVATPEEIKMKLREDSFFHVRRRTYYGDRAAITKFDAERVAIDSGEVEAPSDDLWPGDCNCRASKL